MKNEEINKDDFERQAHLALLAMQKQLMDEYNASYQSWIKYLIALAAGSLTALVSLHNMYMSHAPKSTWLLESCFLLLSGSIILGQLALYGQIQALYDAGVRVGAALEREGQKKVDAWLVANFQGISVTPKRFFHYMYHASAVCFAVALIFLALFAAINFPVPSPPKP